MLVYSITPSARANSVDRTVRPIAFSVFVRPVKIATAQKSKRHLECPKVMGIVLRSLEFGSHCVVEK